MFKLMARKLSPSPQRRFLETNSAGIPSSLSARKEKEGKEKGKKEKKTGHLFV